MFTRVMGCLLVGFALSAPSWGKKPPAEDVFAEIVEPPAHLKAAADDAATRGQAMWEFDQVTALASDRLVNWLTLDTRLSGYVVVRDGPRFTAVWVGVVDGQLAGFYSASFDTEKETASQNVPFDADAAHLPAPFPLTGDQLLRLRAIEAATNAPFERLAATYNTVVLPSGAGFSVYLIPGNKDPAAIPVGGIVRVEVGVEGAVTEVRSLSKTIVTLPRPGTGGVSASSKKYLPMITDFGEHPTEGHVFASRTYGVPLLVVCPNASWYVQGEQVTMIRLPR